MCRSRIKRKMLLSPALASQCTTKPTLFLLPSFEFQNKLLYLPTLSLNIICRCNNTGLKTVLARPLDPYLYL
ncbi:hypothetical protein PRUPE_4G038300 [Prunus persica]|uniref:Uncharacterized protein n=1 Tax=Prunus persica TaxID=3760 RepID=A0A251PFD6_PRUPE|nr:hypothetical protein PRUPE_4G038300 [Prunus persica]ONI10279.1 hypothetical protein PRUPE_4G038300 [Prunus persica]